jgi:hypothetical protein
MWSKTHQILQRWRGCAVLMFSNGAPAGNGSSVESERGSCNSIIKVANSADVTLDPYFPAASEIHLCRPSPCRIQWT